jgi:hypothetical protein
MPVSFVDPSFFELYRLKPGIMRRFEGTPNAAQSPYSPDAVTLSARTTSLNFHRLPLLVGSSMT